MTIRIFHVSDFHLNKKLLKDWNDYMKVAFINFVNENKGEENFIVCTGDMVDKGGAEFGGIEAGLQKFKESVIDSIITETGIPVERFIIAPGNHDIYRDADPDYVREGVRKRINDENGDKINEYVGGMLAGKRDVSKRVEAYFDFAKDLYKGIDNVVINYLGGIYNYELNDHNISFVSFNTAWNCSDDKDRECGLAIGEPQYKVCKAAVLNNAVKIAIMHHPLDWLRFEKQTIQTWVRQDFDLLLMGHIHENDTLLTKNHAGSIILNFAPSFTSDIRKPSKVYGNGFTMIDYDIENRLLDFSYQRYQHSNRSYELNHDYEEDGHFKAEITEGDSDKLEHLVGRCMGYLKQHRIPEIDNSIIPQKAQAIKTLNEAFVMPPLTKNGDIERKEEYSLADILSAQANVVLFGQHESGKTTLLKKMILDYVENDNVFGLIPVYYDFGITTNQDIETIIKNYLDCNSSEVQMLLENSKLILLVDNYNPYTSQKEQTKKLYNFIVDNSIRVIATSNYDNINRVPESFVDNNEIACEYYFIHQFRSTNIKELITKWSPDLQVLERNKKIEDLVNRFCSFSLPCTAMSVSLYLWSTENSTREPVNPSILLDIYMEIVLEKISIDNIYVKTFDYENKANLLAYLAQSIHDELQNNPAYTLSKGHYITKIEDYIKTVVGYEDVDAEKVANYLIDRKVFVLRDGNIEFAHACFYYFFLAKRMDNNPDFRDMVVKRENYIKYARVIEYYSGLKRSDKQLLEFLFDEFEHFFAGAQFIYEDEDIDKFFTLVRKGQVSHLPFIQKISPEKVIEHKPTEKEVENKVLAVADKKLSQIKDQLCTPQNFSPNTLLLLISRVLRNLDGVEDVNLKQKVYDSLIKNALIYIMVVKNSLALYANEHKGCLPAVYGDVKDVGLFLRLMPLNLQMNLGEIMATRKLLVCFKNKYQQDLREDVSDIEKFISLGLMWDCTGLENKKALTKYIKKLGNNSAQDYVLLKLLWNFNNKVALGSKEEDEYIDLLVELKAKQRLIDKLFKGNMKRQLKEARNRKMIEEGKKS